MYARYRYRAPKSCYQAFVTENMLLKLLDFILYTYRALMRLNNELCIIVYTLIYTGTNVCMNEGR